MKLIKFDLPIDGVKVKNIEELREHFTIEILKYFHNGMLVKWLRSRNLNEELLRVNEINSSDDKLILKILCYIFQIVVDEDVINLMTSIINKEVSDLYKTIEILNFENKNLKEKIITIESVNINLNKSKDETDSALISSKIQNEEFKLKIKVLEDTISRYKGPDIGLWFRT